MEDLELRVPIKVLVWRGFDNIQNSDIIELLFVSVNRKRVYRAELLQIPPYRYNDLVESKPEKLEESAGVLVY